MHTRVCACECASSYDLHASILLNSGCRCSFLQGLCPSFFVSSAFLTSFFYSAHFSCFLQKKKTPQKTWSMMNESIPYRNSALDIMARVFPESWSDFFFYPESQSDFLKGINSRRSRLRPHFRKDAGAPRASMLMLAHIVFASSNTSQDTSVWPLSAGTYLGGIRGSKRRRLRPTSRWVEPACILLPSPGVAPGWGLGGRFQAKVAKTSAAFPKHSFVLTHTHLSIPCHCVCVCVCAQGWACVCVWKPSPLLSRWII